MEQRTLRGPRLTLRPVQREDVVTRWRWLSNPQVTRYLPLAGRSSLPREDVERYVEDLMAGRSDLIDFTIEVESGQPVGSCSLRGFDPAGRAELSILLGETEHWGKGYGREAMGLLLNHAFHDLHLHAVWLVVRDDNARAIRLYESLGFRHDGIYRAAVYEDGRYLDKRLMSILVDEWDDAERTT